MLVFIRTSLVEVVYVVVISKFVLTIHKFYEYVN
jgi:hypothetical protein